MTISAEAVEAAWDKLHENPIRPIGIAYAELEAALEAAAPHMLAGAWDEALKKAEDVAWAHDGSASSAVSQIPNPYRPTP